VSQVFIYFIYWSVEHELHVHRSTSSTTRFKTLTVACLNIKTSNNQLNVKNLEKSTELSEFLKVHSVLKFTTFLGKKCTFSILGKVILCTTVYTDKQ